MVEKPPPFLPSELNILKPKLARGYLKLHTELGQTCSGPLQILGTGVGVCSRTYNKTPACAGERDSRGTMEEPMEEPWRTLL